MTNTKPRKKFAGKMFGTNDPHPTVTRIVSGETLPQVRHLHDDRKLKYKAAAYLLRWRQRYAAKLTKRVEIARKAAEAANDRKEQGTASRAQEGRS